jgi:hypothetical protein
VGTHPPAVPPARRRCCACHPRNNHTHVAGCDAWSAPRLPSLPSVPLYSAHPPPYSVALHSTPALASVPSAILPQELRPAPFLPVMPGLRHPYCHSHLHPHHPHHLLPVPLPTTTHPPTHHLPPPRTQSAAININLCLCWTARQQSFACIFILHIVPAPPLGRWARARTPAFSACLPTFSP